MESTIEKECEQNCSTTESDQIVTPWKVVTKGQFNYERLKDEFGLNPITSELIARFEKVTGQSASHLLTREIFFAHQDFDKILDAKEAGKEIYIYTGRGPSAEALHLGHLLPVIFTAELQQALDCWVVIEMSDEEKYYFKDGTLDEFMSYTDSNTKDIIACGFNPEKTFIFSSFKYECYMRPLIAQFNKKMTVHVTNKIFGFNDQNTIGQISWPSYQNAPALCGSFPFLFGDKKDVMCLVPMAVDQTPYFRSTRDVAESLGFPKPAIICCKFLVGLQGVGEKASSSGQIPPIFMNDSDKDITKKINKYAFSGGGATLEEHRKNGGNLSVDVPYIYLFHFLQDEEELKDIAKKYSSGEMLSGEIKARLIKELLKVVNDHTKRRNQITTEMYEKFFTIHVQPSVAKAFNSFKKKYLYIPIAYST